MQKELFNQALELFDTPEKWNAFLEMAAQKESMKLYYFQKLKQPLLKHFLQENADEHWVCDTSWGDPKYDFRWYLKDFGRGSLSLALGWGFQFTLHLEDTNTFDTNIMNDLLKTDYSLILSSFDRVDRQFEPNWKVVEERYYSFGSPYDYNFDAYNYDKLAWFAGNKTDMFVEQIIRKVEVFTKNQALTKMLYDLNQRAKIKLE